VSLINQMLQDLDSRRAASGAKSGLPDEVRPLPPARPARWPLWLAGGAGLLVVAGTFAWYVADLRGAPVPRIEVSTPPVAVAPGLPPRAALPALPTEPAAPDAPVATPAADKADEPPARKSGEREAQLRIATALHLPPEFKPAAIVAAAPANEPAAAPALALNPAPAKSAAPAQIEKTAPAASSRERAEAEYRKALAVLNQGRQAEAIEVLRGALRQDATHVAPRQLLLKLLVENKRLDEAADLLQEGLQVQPAQISWAMSLARLQVDRGDLLGAWQTLLRSLPAAENNADYRGFAAHVLQRLGKHKESAEHYQAATRLAPGEGRWWLGLGLALEADGHPAEAREAFQRARASGTLGAELSNLVEQKLR